MQFYPQSGLTLAQTSFSLGQHVGPSVPQTPSHQLVPNP
jgi:hypothetical protein